MKIDAYNHIQLSSVYRYLRGEGEREGERERERERERAVVYGMQGPLFGEA
jgi:hypothetical protein